MRKNSVILILFLYTFVGYGQINISVKDGYIIPQTHDTIYGEIFDYPTTSLSTKVIFKSNKSDKFKEYSPSDLLGFRIEPDKEFTVVTIEERVRKDTIDTEFFALKAVKGEIEFIVLYLDSGKERFFINSDEFGLTELSQIVKVEDGLKSTDNKYKIELGKYFYKNPVSQKQIDETNFHFKSLSGLINKYNVDLGKPSYVVGGNKDKWHVQVNIGADYYLGEKLDNDNEVRGMVLGLKNSFYDETKNLKIEFVLGLNYRFYSYSKNLLYYTDEYGRIINYPTIVYTSPGNSVDSSTVYNKKTFLYKERADIIEIPLYFEYNNKVKLVSPIVQGGFKPYIIKNKMELENNGTYESDWKLTYDFILGLGIGINYSRFSLKYLVHLNPILMNSLLKFPSL